MGAFGIWKSTEQTVPTVVASEAHTSTSSSSAEGTPGESLPLPVM